jgi:hypothetical protein
LRFQSGKKVAAGRGSGKLPGMSEVTRILNAIERGDPHAAA